MTIAAVGAVIIGATEEAAIVVLLFLVGELLEGVAAGRARASIRDLAEPRAEDRSGRRGRRHARGRRPKPGGRRDHPRPAGRPDRRRRRRSSRAVSAIDEAPVTGESMPKTQERRATRSSPARSTATRVLRVRVTAAAADNTIARVVRLVEEAQESKAPTERFIDRFFRYYTPGVLVVGALVAIMPPLLFGARLGRMDLQGPRHPADRLPLRPGHLDAGRHRRRPVRRRAARPAAEGRRGAREPAARSPRSPSTRPAR